MSLEKLIPAAKYLRMSTERQQYSLMNQSEVIAKYAECHGFYVVKTYSDDYCAEPFFNDSGLPNLILKSLKRVMAGEYSRELGVKVFAAQKRLAALGYRQGGPPGYGLRPLLVSADGKPKQIISDGERKSIANDRVVQIPGPPEEVACVREIYRLFLVKKMSFTAIANELDRRLIAPRSRSRWDSRTIRDILTNPKYAGFNVYGRSSMRLYTPRLEVPRSEWTVSSSAFEALIEPSTFEEVQKIIATYTRNKANACLLDDLKAVLAQKGRLRLDLIETIPGLASPVTYRTRFGSLSRAYELAGYKCHFSRNWLEQLRDIRLLRMRLMDEIAAASAGRVFIEDRGRRFRRRLRLQSGRLVSVIASRYFAGYKGSDRWRIKCASDETRLVPVVARLNRTNNGFVDVFVTPPIRTSKSLGVRNDDPRLTSTVRLSDVHDFVAAVRTVSAKKPGMTWALNEQRDTTASNDHLTRIANFPKRQFICRGINQKTLEKICARVPVGASKLAKCLKVLEECEARADPKTALFPAAV
jgi:DNA invertase Pin-like site-specific DNA recombinase